jgi:purine-cytosine permease-like protein
MFWRMPKVVNLQTDTSLLFIGLAIGASIAIIGGSVDYLISRRRAAYQNTNRLPGCLIYTAGMLGLIGIIAIILSLIISRSIGPAIILGAGVLGGFYAGFTLLMIGYLVFKRF